MMCSWVWNEDEAEGERDCAAGNRGNQQVKTKTCKLYLLVPAFSNVLYRRQKDSDKLIATDVLSDYNILTYFALQVTDRSLSDNIDSDYYFTNTDYWAMTSYVPSVLEPNHYLAVSEI